jgi:Ca2+-binding RTX toxin-like protein
MATLYGTSAPETLNGTADPDVLSGLAGDDTLYGFAGDDRLDGGPGRDHLYGGLGNDTYIVDNVGDVVTENPGEGVDLVSSSISFTLGANLENLTLSSTAANGTGNDLANIMRGTNSANTLDGGSGDDVLIGNGGDDTLIGGSGNDKLNGGSGADRMSGGTGDDAYYVNTTADVVTEKFGEGADTVVSTISYMLGTNLERLVLSGATNIDGTGNSLDNKITGNAGNNMIDGGDGNDTLLGGNGDDTLVGGAGNDRVYGGSGNDMLSISYPGRDLIHGGDGNDFIWSYAGADNDTLYGDSGADVFHFDTYASTQVIGYVPSTSATVMDFTTGVDSIDLTLIAHPPIDHTLHWLGDAAFTGSDRLEARFAHGVLQVDFDGDRVADVTIDVAGTIAASDITYTFDPWGY